MFGDWVGSRGEGGQKLQTSNHKKKKINHKDVPYSMVTTVNNTVVYI